MRLWHYRLLPYLPELQFKGQYREIVAIMHDWRDKGTTNHILINRVMKYHKAELLRYYLLYIQLYHIRYHKRCDDLMKEFVDFVKPDLPVDSNVNACEIYSGWHDQEYLKICMANLLEKHNGVGKSRISDAEWETLLKGYREITGSEYVL